MPAEFAQVRIISGVKHVVHRLVILITALLLTAASVLGLSAPANAATGAISGTVTVAGSGPLEDGADIDPVLVVVTGSNEQMVGAAPVEADGSYLVDGLPTGSYVVEFKNRESTQTWEYYNNQAERSLAERVVVVPGETTTNVNAELPASGSITGEVRYPSGELVSGPSPDLYVAAYSLDGRLVGESSIGEDGTYRIGITQSGQYRVEFISRLEFLQGEFYSDKSSLAASDPVPLTAGIETPGINAKLEFTSYITGKVTDPNGDRIENVSEPVFVSAYSSDGSMVQGRYAYGDGNYYLPISEPGQYRLKFESPRKFKTEFYDNQTSLAKATPVTVEAGTDKQAATTDGVDAQLAFNSQPSYETQIVGQVRNETGELIDGVKDEVRITAYANDDSAVASTALRANGTYEISNLEPGQFRLKFDSRSEAYQTEFYNDVHHLIDARPITVDANTSTSIDAELTSTEADPDTDPATVPGAPAGVTAVAGEASATVTWAAPSDGGSPITGYTVTSIPGSHTCSTTGSTTCTVAGLASTSAYRFSVVATNHEGDSAPSPLSSAVTPMAPALPPLLPDMTPLPSEPPAAAQSVALPPRVLLRNKRKALARTTNAGLPVKWTSLTPRVCKVKGSKLVAGKEMGKCKLRARSVGNATRLTLLRSVTIKIR